MRDFRTKWMDFAVRPNFSWPNVPVEIPAGDSVLVLSPATEDLICSASLFNNSGFEFAEGATQLSKLLSILAWSRRGGLEVYFAAGSNNPSTPGRLGRGRFSTSSWASIQPWNYLYFPSPSSPKASLALALYREGMTLSSEPFAFLSFFKILNILFVDGPSQQAWINANLIHVKFAPEISRLFELQQMHCDVGSYLYTQGRCAVAHAFSNPVADPDDYNDRLRLRKDLPLIQRLAEICIEREFQVPTTDTFLESIRHTDVLPAEYLVRLGTVNNRVRYGPFK